MCVMWCLAGWQKQDHSIRPLVRSDVCVHACVRVCICASGVQDAIWQWRLTPSSTHPCVSDQNRRIMDPDHCTHQTSPKRSTHTSYTQMLWENMLIAVCSCQSNRSFSPSHLVIISLFLFSLRCLFFPNLPHGDPPGTSWDQSEEAQRYSLDYRRHWNCVTTSLPRRELQVMWHQQPWTSPYYSKNESKWCFNGQWCVVLRVEAQICSSTSSKQGGDSLRVGLVTHHFLLLSALSLHKHTAHQYSRINMSAQLNCFTVSEPVKRIFSCNTGHLHKESNSPVVRGQRYP